MRILLLFLIIPGIVFGDNENNDLKNKNIKTVSEIHCKGYVIIFPKHKYKSVKMHKPPFILDSIPSGKKENLDRIRFPGLRNEENDHDFKFNIEPSIMNNTRVMKNMRKNKDLRKNLLSEDTKESLSADILPGNNLSQWGWLADGVYSKSSDKKHESTKSWKIDIQTENNNLYNNGKFQSGINSIENIMNMDDY